MTIHNFNDESPKLFKTPTEALIAFPSAHYIIKWPDIETNEGRSFMPLPCNQLKHGMMLVKNLGCKFSDRHYNLQDEPLHLPHIRNCPNIATLITESSQKENTLDSVTLE